MNFVSLEFLVFFSVVFGLYYFLTHRQQNYLLLAASLLFYGWWDWRFVGLLVATSCMDFYCARWVDPYRHHSKTLTQRKRILILSLIGNLSVLAIFKYYNFFIESLLRMAGLFHVSLSFPLLRVILPVGISFFTFHEMSYTIDVYKGEFHSVDNFRDYLLYVCFFPHLVAGPIQRAHNLLPQIQNPRRLSWDNIYSGFQLVLVGYFKKMVIADNLSAMVDTLYRSPPNGGAIVLATYAFAFQIYCDFSGYTDIARGTARMLGVQIPLNFNMPYLAATIREFWQRWHISLSTWLKDYLYIPLGGNRQGRMKTWRNLMLTMVLGGLWHGASWHYIVWGLYHGVLLTGAYIWASSRPIPWSTSPTQYTGLSHWIRVFVLFQFVCLGWSMFRVTNLHQWLHLATTVLHHTHLHDFLGNSLIKLTVFASPLVAMEIYQYRHLDLEPWTHWPVAGKVLFYLVIGYSLAWMGSPTRLPFIYFQF
jgi:alginate O-acetyltransferase complex protein AlgI